MAVSRTSLRPGYEISRVIKGGWQLAGDHGEVDSERVVKDMAAFVDAGVTAFDCADIYTGVEELIGQFFVQNVQAKSGEITKCTKIHTKYVPDRDSLSTLKFTDVEAVIDRSLLRLRQERLDLVQFHWWDYDTPGYLEAMNHLKTLQQAGKIDLLGVTNFDAAHLVELCGVADIVSAQIQYSLLDTRPAGTFADAARAHNVSLLTYGVLAGGFLTDAWLGKPDPGYVFENRSLVKYRLIIDEFGGWDLFQALLSNMRRIADRHGVDISTIAVRAMLDNPDVAATIVGARYADRLPHTLAVFEFDLTGQDRSDLDSVLSQRSGPFGEVFGLERDMSGVHGRIMKYNLNKGDNSKFQDGAS